MLDVDSSRRARPRPADGYLRGNEMRGNGLRVIMTQSTILLLLLFIEYATSAGHHKNMYTHRNEKKRHKTLWKKAYTHKNTIKSKA